MNIINRVKNIIVSPQKEWDVIKAETPNIPAIITGYVLPLAGAAAVAAFIGYSFMASRYAIGGTSWGLYYAVYALVSAIVSVFISSFVIDLLAPSFGSEKNMGRSVQLVAYSYTPGWIGGLLAIVPVLGIIGALFGLYGFYLLYLGMPKLKNTPEDKHIGYFVVSIITMIVVYFLIGWILAAIFMPIFGLSYGFRL